MDSHGASRIALFVDAENLVISAQKQALPVRVRWITDRVRENGVLSFARAYADWTQPYMAFYIGEFRDNVVEMTQLSAHYGKNTGDIQVVVDALEMALSPNSPDVFVIVAGDRDYVPLIQRLKRHGKYVIGISIREAASMSLERVCDTFIFYESLVPGLLREESAAGGGLPEDEPEAQAAELDEEKRAAFELLSRAVMSLERDRGVALGATVRQVMQQLDPTFDLSRFSYGKFKEFVDDAAQHKHVAFAGEQGLDFKLTALRSTEAPEQEAPKRFLKREYETTQDILQACREVLAAKNVPLVPWHERRVLIEHLWLELAAAPGGLTIEEMNGVLENGAAKYFLRVPFKALQKIVYTLNIAHCFARDGVPAFERDLFNSRLEAGCTLEEALFRTNRQYIRIIRNDDPGIPRLQRPLALLLFDKDGDSEAQLVDEILERLGDYRD